MATNLWEEYLKTDLGRTSKVQSGLTTPWETPEYRAMFQGLQSDYAKNLSELEKTLSAKGITGGAASQAYADLASGKNTNILNMINQIMGQYSQKGADIATGGANRELERYKAMLAAWSAEQNREAAREAERMQGITSGFNTAMSSKGCCFIFIEGDRLTTNVKTLRDQMFPKGGIVENGYRRMAKWLVPIMARNPFVRRVVQFIMLDPICSIADYHYGCNSYGWVFKPIGHFWKTVWKKMG